MVFKSFLHNESYSWVLVACTFREEPSFPLAEGEPACERFGQFESVAWVEVAAMPGLEGCSKVVVMRLNNEEVVDILFNLLGLKLEDSLSAESLAIPLAHWAPAVPDFKLPLFPDIYHPQIKVAIHSQLLDV